MWRDIHNKGEYELAEERKRKFGRDTTKLFDAEQYVLRARVTGYYPCPSCAFRDSIFLYVGEVYRYGITINGAVGRGYTMAYLDKNQLSYFPQFYGNWLACKIEELRKIYTYPLLPENIKRRQRIARPPGNPVDG